MAQTPMSEDPAKPQRATVVWFEVRRRPAVPHQTGEGERIHRLYFERIAGEVGLCGGRLACAAGTTFVALFRGRAASLRALLAALSAVRRDRAELWPPGEAELGFGDVTHAISAGIDVGDICIDERAGEEAGAISVHGDPIQRAKSLARLRIDDLMVATRLAAAAYAELPGPLKRVEEGGRSRHVWQEVSWPAYRESCFATQRTASPP